MTVDAYGEGLRQAEVKYPTRLQVRCASCGKLLAEMVTAPWLIACSRCKADNRSAEID